MMKLCGRVSVLSLIFLAACSPGNGSSGGGGASSGAGSSGAAGGATGNGATSGSSAGNSAGAVSSGSSTTGGTGNANAGASSGSSSAGASTTGASGGKSGSSGNSTAADASALDATTSDVVGHDGSPPACEAGGSGGGSTLAVNVDGAQYTVANEIFGVLMEELGRNWQNGFYVGTSSSIANTSGLRNDIIAGFKEAGVAAIGWPGGCAAGSYNWNTNKSHPSGGDIGTDLYMQLTGLVGTTPYLVGPGLSTSATSNANWVTYVDTNSANPSWNVPFFKIGNEVWGCGGNQDVTGASSPNYPNNFAANYSAFQAATALAGKGPKLIASTALIDNVATTLQTELDAIGVNKVDGIEVHDYVYHSSDIPCVGFTDAQYYQVVDEANQGQIGPRVASITKILDSVDTAKRIKIFEDEWGDWLKPFNASADGWMQQITVMDALSTAESLHIFMQHADRYQLAGLAQAVNVIHSLFLTNQSDGTLVKTPAFYVFKMMVPHHSSGAKWAPNTLTSEMITGNGKTFPVLSAGTTVDSAGNVNVSLANVDLTMSRHVQINLTSSGHAAYTVGSAQIVTGPAKDSYNDFGKPETVNAQSLSSANYTVCDKTLSVTLPPMSVVMLVLNPW